MYRLKLCAIVFTMNWGMDNWVHYCFYSSTSPQTKLKPMKKHQLRATALMSHELMAITCNSLVRYNQIRIFKLFLIGQIRCHSGFNRWLPPSPRTRHVKKLQIFFENMQLFTHCISTLHTEKLHCTIMLVFADPVTYSNKYHLQGVQVWHRTSHYPPSLKGQVPWDGHSAAHQYEGWETSLTPARYNQTLDENDITRTILWPFFLLKAMYMV